MNSMEEETLSNQDQDSLCHYGMPRRSGRYPWGSGDDSYQRGRDFISRVEELRKQNPTYIDDKGKVYTGDTAIAKMLKLSTTEFRTEYSLAKDERKALEYARIKSLQEDGLNPTEIGRIIGKNESSVRSIINGNAESRMKQAKETADYLRNQIETKGMIDVGKNSEQELGVSKGKLDQALYMLQKEGYPIYSGGISQINNPGKQTIQKVICPKGTEHGEIYNYDKIHSINEDNYISRDGGKTFEKKFTYPASMDSKRLKIRYADDVGPDGATGLQKDGIIELRRGVQDLSLGDSHYSQVRILVDGTHYLKGMAVYSDNMPDGVDVVFNTNKSKDVPMEKVLKEIKKDPDNPFGSTIKDADQGGQYWYEDKKTGERKLGLINKKSDEGDWSEWADALPSQFLSKQNLNLAKKQLNLAKQDKLDEYEDICSINNPTIKKHFLNKFAEECDSAAVDLKAAALPGQKYHVILPINTLKDNEVYAPGYENGTKLALIRYPHAGTFEIPILTVNNKNELGKRIIDPGSVDAIGINKNNADRLSGADFDGDTVMCIPTHDSKGKVRITSTDYLKGLKNFDPGLEYGADYVTKDQDGTEHCYRNGREFRKLKGEAKQNEMGKISNLITDMTLLGATDKELERAVKHSMVVIDAEKHNLDYKQSERDNNIAALKKLYQPKYDEEGNLIRVGGASTIISKSSGQKEVLKRQGNPKINVEGKEWYDPSKPEGALIYKTAFDLYYPDNKYNKKTKEMTITTSSGKKIKYSVEDKEANDYYKPVKVKDENGNVKFTNKTGEIEYRTKTRTQKSTQMAETDDAYSLVSNARHPMELLYADYANNMKALANRARMEYLHTGNIEQSKSAKETYKQEISSLDVKLNNAEINSLRERSAQRKANAEKKRKMIDNPDMTPDEIRKMGQQSLNRYREEVGSISRKKRSIIITDREWEAIQAGAISESKLKRILNNADIDDLRNRATPKSRTTLSANKIATIKAMRASNYDIAAIAKKLGVSTSTVSKYL